MYSRILACINLQDSSAAEAVMKAAQAQASAAGAKVTVAAVVPDYGLGIVRSYFPEGYEEKVTEGVKADLDSFADQHGGGAVDRWVGHGSVHREAVRAAEEIGADLIVVGSGDSDVTDQILGSQASRIVAHAPCTVLVVRS